MTADVLVVDDDPMLRRTLVQLIREYGHEGTAVASAEDALAHMARTPCRLVLADVRLPGRNGLDLLREIRSRHAGTQVVMITGYGSVEMAVEAMQNGAQDLLVKPFGMTRLGELLERMLGTPAPPTSLAGIVTQDPRSAASAGNRGTRGAERGTGPDPGRERHWEGASGPGDPPAQRAPGQALRGPELRRPARVAPGKRIVRPRARGVHRGHRAPARAVRGGPPGNAPAGRDQRDQPAVPGETPARPPGGRAGSDRPRPARTGRRAGHRHDEPGPA